jgi:hypothetical protein
MLAFNDKKENEQITDTSSSPQNSSNRKKNHK